MFTAGEAALRPLRTLAESLLDLSDVQPFTQLQQEFPSGRQYYWTSAYLTVLPEEALEPTTTLAVRKPSLLSTVNLWRLGDALDRVPVKAGAYSTYLLGFEANWDEPDLETCARNIAWIRGCLEAFAPCFRAGTYLNFPGIEEDVLAQAPSEPHLQRLKAVREQYDLPPS